MKGSRQANVVPDERPTMYAQATIMKQIARNDIGRSGYRNLVESMMNVRSVKAQHAAHMAAAPLIMYLSVDLSCSFINTSELHGAAQFLTIFLPILSSAPIATGTFSWTVG